MWRNFRLLSILFLAVTGLFSPLHGNGEDYIKGRILSDADGRGVGGVIVRLYVNDNLRTFSRSRADGSFNVKDPAPDSLKILKFLSPKYETKDIEIRAGSDSIQVILFPKNFELPEFVARVPRTRVKGDTITYDVASFTNATDRSIEDIIKKLPGIEVQDNGRILYDGEAINHLYIEGLDLMGENYAVASRNIKPEDISTISVYERHQPKRVLRGIQSSKKAALNLKLKKGRLLKPVGYVSGGAGAGSGALWQGNLYLMEIAPTFQTIVSAKGNNTGTPYLKPSDGNLADGLFPQTPFGQPSVADNRFWDNKSLTTSVNGLMKLKNETQLKANVSYYRDDKSYSGSQEIEYLGVEDSTLAYYHESVYNHLISDNIGVGLQIERNIDRLYFSDRVSFGGSFADNDYEIENGDLTREGLRSKRYSLSNNLNTVWKRGSQVYDFKSRISYVSVPGSRMSFFKPDISRLTSSQRLDVRTFRTSESLSFIHKFNPRWQLGTEVGIDYDHQNFFSSFDEFSGSYSDFAVSGNKFLMSLKPSLKYSIASKFSFTLSFPLVLTSVSYLNDESKRREMSRFRPDAELMLFFKLYKRNTLDASFGITNSVGGIRDFITTPIQTTFRNVTVLGTGELGKTQRKYAGLSFVMRTFEKPSNLRVGVAYSRTEKNSMGSSQVTDAGVQNRVISRSASTDNTNFNASYTKNLLSSNLIIGGDLSGTLMSSSTIRGDKSIKVANSLFGASAHVTAYMFNDRLSANILGSYSVSHQNFHGVSESTRFDDYSLRGKIEYKAIEKLIFSVRMNMNRSEIVEGQYKSNLFLDAGIRWLEGRWEAEIKATNLTNMKTYSYRIYKALDIITYSYGLRPLEVCATFRLNF